MNDIMVKTSTDLKKVILFLLGMGLSNAQIASNIGLDEQYVNTITNMYDLEEHAYSNDSDIIDVDKVFIHPVIVTATVYNASMSQTDSTPMITADGYDLHGKDLRKERVLAASRDLLVSGGGVFSFGDRVRVEGAGDMDGVWIIHDVMNSRYEKYIDFLVPKNIRHGLWYGVKVTTVD